MPATRTRFTTRRTMFAIAIVAFTFGCVVQLARWGKLSRDYRQRANGLGARESVCQNNRENLLAEAQILRMGGIEAIALARSKFRRYAYSKDDHAIEAGLSELSSLVTHQAEIYARAADHFARIKTKYDRAAHRPWLDVPNDDPPDPPDPGTMGLQLFEDFLKRSAASPPDEAPR